jgi:hypothetical protein
MTIIGYSVFMYLLAGLGFAIAFAAKGCVAVDGRAQGGGVIFRVMLMPAAALLWPYLLLRWCRGVT